ncbi:MAG: aldehyde dehydrogenase EutE [Turicibacter sp.]|nr:aldehyde dehydrogenase EutE [Turicibacter sp.]
MELKLTESDLQGIVQSVLKNMEIAKPVQMKAIIPATAASPIHEPPAYPLVTNDRPVYEGEIGKPFLPVVPAVAPKEAQVSKLPGVYDAMSDAIMAADMAQKAFAVNYDKAGREKTILAIREVVLKNKEKLAQLVFEETGFGVLAHKVAKHELAAAKTPGTEDLETVAFSSGGNLTLLETSPFGVIGAVTPVTNPTETIINNAISMLAGGNSVVFNVHPASKKSCSFLVGMLNEAIVASGGIPNLITMVQNPTTATLEELMTSPTVRLLVGTGGPGLGKKLQLSGKKSIVAGAGNPPVIVDETANLKKAAQDIIFGAGFDNNLLCIAEKEVFVLDAVADDLIFHLLNEGAYMLDSLQVQRVMGLVLEENKAGDASGCTLENSRRFLPSKHWIGRCAGSILKGIGAMDGKGTEQLLIFEAAPDHPFVQIEQMMPIMPIVRVKDLDEAIRHAVQAEHGNRHTAVMHSQNLANLNRFENAIQTTIFVKNASSLAGVGFGAEGFGTMTIAGPTGEGLTSARTFTRKRRSVLVSK